MIKSEQEILEQYPELVEKLEEIIRLQLQDDELPDEEKTGEGYQQYREFIQEHHQKAIECIELALTKEDMWVKCNLLSSLGQSEDLETYFSRRNILFEYLSSKVPIVQYGSIIGLSHMVDDIVFKRFKIELKNFDKYRSGTLQSLIEQVVVLMDKKLNNTTTRYQVTYKDTDGLVHTRDIKSLFSHDGLRYYLEDIKKDPNYRRPYIFSVEEMSHRLSEIIEIVEITETKTNLKEEDFKLWLITN